jgi:hypothetical protein
MKTHKATLRISHSESDPSVEFAILALAERA